MDWRSDKFACNRGKRVPIFTHTPPISPPLRRIAVPAAAYALKCLLTVIRETSNIISPLCTITKVSGESKEKKFSKIILHTFVRTSTCSILCLFTALTCLPDVWSAKRASALFAIEYLYATNIFTVIYVCRKMHGIACKPTYRRRCFQVNQLAAANNFVQGIAHLHI